MSDIYRKKSIFLKIQTTCNEWNCTNTIENVINNHQSYFENYHCIPWKNKFDTDITCIPFHHILTKFLTFYLQTSVPLICWKEPFLKCKSTMIDGFRKIVKEKWHVILKEILWKILLSWKARSQLYRPETRISDKTCKKLLFTF